MWLFKDCRWFSLSLLHNVTLVCIMSFKASRTPWGCVMISALWVRARRVKGHWWLLRHAILGQRLRNRHLVENCLLCCHNNQNIKLWSELWLKSLLSSVMCWGTEVDPAAIWAMWGPQCIQQWHNINNSPDNYPTGPLQYAWGNPKARLFEGNRAHF